MKQNKLEIVLIRHGITENNLEGRFCGRADVPLNQQGMDAIKKRRETYPYPSVDWIVSSPSTRCRQTAELSFPGQPIEICQDLQEFDFGEFERRCASEMLDRPEYLDGWRRQDPEFHFAGGETLGHVQARGTAALRRIVRLAVERDCKRIAVVSHSIWISQVLKGMLAEMPSNPTELMTPNGMGLFLEMDPTQVDEEKPLHYLGLAPAGEPRPDMKNNPYLCVKDRSESQK